jgi:nucleoside-diphosphate-sugar epimerase
VLVTGGSGAVGRYVVVELLQHGYRVGVLDRVDPQLAQVTFHEADILDLDAVTQAMAGYDAVVHVAGIPHPLNDPAKRVFDVNVNGTFNTLEAAAQHGIDKVVMTSSESTLGFAFMTHAMQPLSVPIDEQHPGRPQDPYGLSKVVCEQICKTYSARHRMRTVCLRAPWIWLPEPDQRPFYQDLVRDYGNWTRNLWTFVDARDVARAHRLALESQLETLHEAFFITAADNWTGRDSRGLLAQYYPDVDAAAIGAELQGAGSLISHGKAARLLGYRPQFGVRDILGEA